MDPLPAANASARAASLDEGRRLHAAGDLAAAEAVYLARLETVPGEPAALHLLGVLRHQQGRHEEAVRLIEEALRAVPDMAAAWQNVVLPLVALGRGEEAFAAAGQAARLAPDAAGAWINRALAALAAGRTGEAAEAAETAVALDPTAAVGWQHLGTVRGREGRWRLAERHFRRALSCDPEAADARAGLAESLYEQARPEEAAALWRRQLELRPGDHVARVNLGAALRAAGNVPGALAVWSEGPRSAELDYNAGSARLSLGDWPAGWAGYERRWDIPLEPLPGYVAGLPLWTGGPVGTLLVHHEQGLGDTIQVAPLLPLLPPEVERIVLVCQRPLAALLRAMPPLRAAAGRVAVIADGDPLPPADARLPLLSVPHRIGLGLADPNGGPTIVPDPERAARWRAFLDHTDAGPAGALTVGLVWQGNPKAPAERGRSLPLATLAPLAGVPGVTLVALQKGPGREQIANAGVPLVVPPDDFDAGPDAFLDTAALVAGLDLVVTTDTSVAHVAAATGRTVWLLLRRVPDWRWGLTGEDVPWYPSVRLFRQERAGDWDGVVARVAAALREAAAAKAAGDPGGARAFEAAVKLHAAGRPADALPAYRRRRLLAPGDARAANFLALALRDLAGGDPGRLAEAAVLARRSAALAPADADLRTNAAVVLKAAGDVAGAEALLRAVLADAPAHPAAVQNLVGWLAVRGAADEAVRVATAAATLAPRDPAALKALAAGLRAARRLPDAAAALRLALAAAPDDDEARNTLGSLLTEAGDSAAARAVFEEVLDRDPGNVDAWSNLGVVEKRLAGPELPVWIYGRALARNPAHVDARSNLGSALVELGRWDDAAEAFRAALVRRPDHPEAHMALGMSLLADGRYAEGWAEYEGRVGSQRLGLAAAAPNLPRWTGEDIRGRSLLVLCEQGFGDAIQFVRYAAVVKAMGAARVLVGCRRRLAALLAGADGVDGTVAEGQPLPPVDLFAHVMSLPKLCGTTLETVPAAVPYLRADPERVTAWARRLAERPGLRVGLVWQGNPDPAVDRGRSLPLAALEPLARIPGVRLIALQKGPGSEQVEALAGRFPVETLGPDFDEGPDAFRDTAAVMENLDLVVSTDTAALHLAGALGRPAFALLKRHAEWRWLKAREDSPWYPTLRLFRQTDDEAAGPDPFAGAVARLAGTVAALAAGDRAALLPRPVPPAAPRPPETADTRFEAALAAHRAGAVAEAEARYAALLADHPGHLGAVHMLGAAALQRRDFRRALILLREVRAMGLDTPELRTNLAVALRRTGRPAEAETLLAGVLAEAPTGEAWSTLGGILADADRLEDAVRALTEAVRLAPGLAPAWRTLGNTLRDLGRLPEALDALDRAVAADPADPEGYIDRAHARLMAGDLRAGFADYEWRWRGLELRPRALDVPRWDGRPFGGTLLVHGEQGLGDNIQFARFVHAARARVGRVVLEVRRPLVRLMAGLGPAVTVVEQGAPLPPHDAEIPLMSLPHALGLDLSGIGMPAPYLAAEPARVARWRDRLGPYEGLTVGLVWQGNPKARADKGRSPPLAALAPLFAVPGVRFVALQKEHGLDQLDAAAPILRPGPDFDAGDDAFLDTAAILALCDRVVTSDTAVAHLAGALGRPTLLMLKHVADWRWLTGRDDSPWYPSLCLVRQTSRGDWAGVAARVAGLLRAEADAR